MTAHAGKRIERERIRRWPLRLMLAFAALELFIFSQSVMYGDEGFHLLAAWLVGSGKMPYRDFFYQHPPLFPYLYAAWMQISGESWRSAHLFSALLSFGTVYLVATYLARRYPDAPASVAIFTFLLLCLNPQFVWLGTVGHPYALCMFLSVLSYRLVLYGVEHVDKRVIFLAGLAAGGSVLSSFLSVPFLAVMPIWIIFQAGTAHRMAQTAWFAAGSALWLAPLAGFFLQAPQPMLFNIVEYQLHYRWGEYRLPHAGSVLQGLRVLASWARSWEMVAGSLLSIVGLWSLLRRAGRERENRADVVLAAVLAGALALFIGTPYPTFWYYLVVLTPFVCILSFQGVIALARTRWTLRRYAVVFVIFAAAGTGNVLRPAQQISETVWDSMSKWNDVETAAALINRHTPPDAAVYVPEDVYFAARRLPPRGLENAFGAELQIPPKQAAALNIVLNAQIDEWIRQRRFAAIVLDIGDPRIPLVVDSGSHGGYKAIETPSSMVYVFPW